MALLQALFAMLGRSAGKFLNAIFGWAVRALFGAASGAEQTLLTALVATAALWPLLIAGIAAPRVATWALAFVPISKAVSTGALRLAWLGLALLVPGLVGIAMAARRPAGARRESAFARAARGYPMTLGMAAAFWFTFVTVPVLQFRSALRRHQQTYVPLITSRDGYEQTAKRIRQILEAHGFEIAPRRPTFWMRAPLAILRALGGDAMNRYAPEEVAYFAGPDLEVVLHPSSLLLRGSKVKTTIAHGLVVEGLTATDSYQTTDARAQDIERQIRKVWARLNSNCSAHTNSPWLSARLEEITAEVAELGVSYDEWQIIYRQLLQLARALRGEPQLLANNDGENMDEFDRQLSEIRELDSRSLTTAELFSRIASKTTLLVNKEIDLLREESREDLRSELASIKGLAAAAVAAIAALNLALTAAVFALAAHMAPVSAALILAAIALAIAIAAAAIAWRKHVEQPLDLTRKTVKEDVQWAKEQMA